MAKIRLDEAIEKGLSTSFLIELQNFLNNPSNYEMINSKLRETPINMVKDDLQITFTTPKELYDALKKLNAKWPNNRCS